MSENTSSGKKAPAAVPTCVECVDRFECMIGGEQSGHIIFAEHTTTGDGILSSLQLMEALLASGKTMAQLSDEIRIYPQVLVNARIHNDFKKTWQKDPEVAAEIAAVEKAVEGSGRLLIRPSGTEPLVRVMLEGSDLPLLDHADGPRDGFVRIVDDGAGKLAGNEGAVRLIGAVSEHLAGNTETDLPARFDHLAVGKTEQNDVLVHFGDRFRDGKREIHILARHVVKSAVGLAVLESEIVGLCKGHQRAKLVLDVCLRFFRRTNHVATTKAHQIRVAGVRADRDTRRFRVRDSLIHHERIAGMIAAGDVCRRDMSDHFFIKPDLICAEAFTQIAVEVYFVHNDPLL